MLPSTPNAPPPDEFGQLAGLYNARRYAELESRARAVLGQYPVSGFAWKYLGAALQMQGKNPLAAFQQAAELLPHDADARWNLGNAFFALGRFNEAAASYRQLAKLKPDFAGAYHNLGFALENLGQFDDAVDSYRRAISIKPDAAVTHYNLAIVLQELGRVHEAATCCRRALELKPDFTEAHSNLGSFLKDTGQFDEAVASYRRALKLDPGNVVALSNLLFVLNYSSKNSPEYRLEEARRYGGVAAKLAKMRFSAWLSEAAPKRLRVGLVSGDLRGHPVGQFLESMLAHLDKTRIELFAYATNPKADDLTARIKPHFAAWKSLFRLSDADAARMIHADGVHVLLDLSGHTAHNRLPLFACKPAPIQASWLGYLATSGVAEMDYLLADQIGLPEAHRKHYTESVWYLPDTMLCFTAPADLPVSPLPALSSGVTTLGCFQNLAKVSDDVLAAWGSIFAALPDARLRMQSKPLGETVVAEQLSRRLLQHGITPNRVTLHGAAPSDQYLAAHAEVDLILDTFPYAGCTTTCNALWMGVPTLTLAGDSLLARQGASILMAAGLEEWVATSKEEYVSKAIALAADKPKLAALRAGLRRQVLASPLFDAPRFARNFENALWGMWQTYQSPGKQA